MSTKIFLRRLTDMSTFSLLQEKLARLNDTYSVSSLLPRLTVAIGGFQLNSCDTNVSRCIDIIELNARVQRELFKLLNLVSAEGKTSLQKRRVRVVVIFLFSPPTAPKSKKSRSFFSTSALC